MYSLTQDVKKLLGVNDEDITPEKLSTTEELQSETSRPLTVKNNIEVLKETDNEKNDGITYKNKVELEKYIRVHPQTE